jgi:hypothetical protein
MKRNPAKAWQALARWVIKRIPGPADPELRWRLFQSYRREWRAGKWPELRRQLVEQQHNPAKAEAAQRQEFLADVREALKRYGPGLGRRIDAYEAKPQPAEELQPQAKRGPKFKYVPKVMDDVIETFGENAHTTVLQRGYQAKSGGVVLSDRLIATARQRYIRFKTSGKTLPRERPRKKPPKRRK